MNRNTDMNFARCALRNIRKMADNALGENLPTPPAWPKEIY